jgi:hypothetical protein
LSAAAEKDDCAQVCDDPSSVYSATNSDPYSDNKVICRKSLASGPPKSADKPMSALKTAAPMAAVAASSTAGGTSWTVLLIADAWDFSRWVTEFLEGLKIGKLIGKVSPLFLLMPQSIDTLH